MEERILQFGTGNFLRGFAEEMIGRMNRLGLFDGGVVAVSPTGSGAAKRLNDRGCRYHLALRGARNGLPVERIEEITCISRAVDPYADFDAFLALAQIPTLRFVISNTTEAGIVFDENCRFTDRPAESFPAKLTQLLYRRFQAGLPGFVFLPCELIDDNASALKRAVLSYAALWELGEGFARYIGAENEFCPTLVDRIVSGFPADPAERDSLFARIGEKDPLLVTAEPYALWAIGGDHEKELPLAAAGCPAVWSADVEALKKRKVRLLNGAHTSAVFLSLLLNIETVAESMRDSHMNAFIDHMIFQVALPVLGDTPENRAFANAVPERFANPFIRHRWADIALHSVSKFRVRVLPTVFEYHALFGEYPKAAALALAALIRYDQTNACAEPEAAFIREHSAQETLSNGALWGRELGGFADAVRRALEFTDIREGIAWSLS